MGPVAQPAVFQRAAVGVDREVVVAAYSVEKLGYLGDADNAPEIDPSDRSRIGDRIGAKGQSTPAQVPRSLHGEFFNGIGQNQTAKPGSFGTSCCGKFWGQSAIRRGRPPD